MKLRNILKVAGGKFAFNSRYRAIREPKRIGSVDYEPDTEAKIIKGLTSIGIKVEVLAVGTEGYRRYFDEAEYSTRYRKYYVFNIAEKSLEHYIAAELLSIKKDDVYIDIASENSPAPEIYSRLYGCESYRQDLSYPEGLNGDRIGGNAAAMPVPDGFADSMALHCSFEHFEGTADMDFIKETGRVLKKGGRCCIAPLYMFDTYAVQTDPGFSGGVVFEDDVVVYCAKGWNNRHGRFYDPAQLKDRVIDNLGGLRYRLFRVTNAKGIDPSCYIRFALLLEKP